MERNVQHSYTEHVEMVTMACLNGAQRLFGGMLMQWIDIVAGVVAKRHSGRNVTTAQIDALEFKGPAFAGDTVVLKGTLYYVGRTSMEVCVQSFVEALDGSQRLITSAFVVMVALDDMGNPTPVPGLTLETQEQKEHFAQGQERSRQRKQRRKG